MSPEKKELPKPSCGIGYTVDDLKNIIGHDLTEFYQWMRGQTFSSCTGQSYSHEYDEMVDTGCGPHGYVFYYHDVRNFMQRKK